MSSCLIETLYIRDRLSLRAIAKKIGKSECSVYKYLKNKKLTRNHSEAILNRNAKCDYKRTFLTDHLVEIIDGFMLGDGHIQKLMSSARFSACLNKHAFCEYWLQSFQCYDPRMSLQIINDKRYKSEIQFWNFTTKSHPDIEQQRDRWYQGKTKIVPKDVKITPLSVSLWFCGDGSRASTKSSTWANFCTQGFDNGYVEMLSKKLNDLGINCHVTKQNKIYVSTIGYRNLLNYCHCPVDCYSYKFKQTIKVNNQ